MAPGDGGGDRPGGDDYGLPPVDVEIPDDASELARDVIAYRRELRQRRRRRFLRGLARPLRAYGGIPALAICAAVLVVFAVTMMTITGSPPDRHATPGRGPTANAGGGNVGRLLPNAKVEYRGTPVSLLDLHRPGLLVVLPGKCRCATTVSDVASRARRVRIALYLVTERRPGRADRTIAERAGEPRSVFVRDTGGALAHAYRPRGLTVVLVHSDGAVGGVLRSVTSRSSGRLSTAVLRRLYVSGQGDPALPSAT